MPDSDRPLRLKSDVRFRSVAGEGIVLRQDEGEVLVVNGVGIRVVELIGAGSTEAAIVRALDGEYDVPADELRADVSRYLDELARAGVLDDSG